MRLLTMHLRSDALGKWQQESPDRHQEKVGAQSASQWLNRSCSSYIGTKKRKNLQGWTEDFSITGPSLRGSWHFFSPTKYGKHEEAQSKLN